MKTIGILGGMSAVSTALYYNRLNAGVAARLGGLHSAQVLLRSLDFAEIEGLQAAGDWHGAGALLNHEARALELGGADFLLLATNTMHKVAVEMMSGVSIPFLHIGDATAQEIVAAGHGRPGLVATAFTMEQAFYVDRLRAAGLDPVLPDAADRAEVHRIIYDELCKSDVRVSSRQIFEDVAARLIRAGADCLILGCTEVGLLLNDRNVSVPVFDTTEIHCQRALDIALASGEGT